eukprot:COSAG01_NODE_22853_length_838_cov_1.427605_1_plen_160_part_00
MRGASTIGPCASFQRSDTHLAVVPPPEHVSARLERARQDHSIRDHANSPVTRTVTLAGAIRRPSERETIARVGLNLILWARRFEVRARRVVTSPASPAFASVWAAVLARVLAVLAGHASVIGSCARDGIPSPRGASREYRSAGHKDPFHSCDERTVVVD